MSADVAGEMEARITAVLQAYDAQGCHRTGTAVDGASAEWLAAVAKEAGAEARLESFELSRVQPTSAYVESQGRRIEGLPLFDAPPISGGVLNGALGPLGSGSPIGLLITRSPAPDEHYDALRREAGHEALIAVTVGRRPGLQARNANSFKEPFGVPVLQVSSEQEEFLQRAADSGASATLAISIDRVPARSCNVVARVPGADSELSPIVISTPRSGWWNCASERGGGIACWLEVLRSAVAQPFARDAIFAGFAGHELGHTGLDDFLDRHPDIATSAHVWVHFGANAGAAKGPSVRVSASLGGDLEQARAALEREQVGELTSPPAGTVNGGESAVVAGLGARCIALLGGNDLFHLESDRWPEANDIPQIGRQARAFSVLVRQLAGRE